MSHLFNIVFWCKLYITFWGTCKLRNGKKRKETKRNGKKKTKRKQGEK